MEIMGLGYSKSVNGDFLFRWFYFEVRIPTAVQPMTGIEGFKNQASDG